MSPNSNNDHSLVGSRERQLNNTNNLIEKTRNGGGVFKEPLHPKLIRVNNSKKRLDTARRSRIQKL